MKIQKFMAGVLAILVVCFGCTSAFLWLKVRDAKKEIDFLSRQNEIFRLDRASFAHRYFALTLLLDPELRAHVYLPTENLPEELEDESILRISDVYEDALAAVSMYHEGKNLSYPEIVAVLTDELAKAEQRLSRGSEEGQ
ncbi:hypothetical protein [Rhodopirellula islandica]|uniref:hypothetical protein n=1 Tax=Rhodopirellula islandica TaxID=595434 RepID=UPI00064B0925|nr:hypothetical protein [Rhodopirellula islandica]